MWPRFGIKIGNSSVCIATVKNDGKIEVIANKQGYRVSPACLLCDYGEIEVGLTAKQKMSSKILSTVANNLLMMQDDLNPENLKTAQRYMACKYNETSKKYEFYERDENKPYQSMTPYEVCVEFFKASFDLARQCHLTEDHPSVVLSIPEYYSNCCWRNLAKAAESAGFKVSQIITEPTAGALAYKIDEINKNESIYVLFVKCGGICTSFSFLEINNGLYSVLSTVGPYFIGGEQYTEVLVEFISKEFCKKFHLNPKESRRSMAKIHSYSENCKHQLTTSPTAQIYIDSLMNGIDFNLQMSRARYENLIQPVINEFMMLLNGAVETMKDKIPKIDEIVLAGGTLKIPKIQSMISLSFPNANLNMKLPTDEVIAIGCARQATFLLDVNVQDLERTSTVVLLKADSYIWHDDIEKKTLLFRKGTIIPKIIELDILVNSTLLTFNEDGNINGEIILNFEYDHIVEKVMLLETKSPINGLLHIEANIAYENDDDERPSIFMRAI